MGTALHNNTFIRPNKQWSNSGEYSASTIRKSLLIVFPMQGAMGLQVSFT